MSKTLHYQPVTYWDNSITYIWSSEAISPPQKCIWHFFLIKITLSFFKPSLENLKISSGKETIWKTGMPLSYEKKKKKRKKERKKEKRKKERAKCVLFPSSLPLLSSFTLSYFQDLDYHLFPLRETDKNNCFSYPTILSCKTLTHIKYAFYK